MDILIAYNLLFDGLGEFKYLLQIGFPTEQIVSYKLTHRKFMRERS